ncbi:MAG: hypothetical protein CSYNP_00270 [Syntrophus sp. SKADARSKE-3]|nr:hypothetical protein [Syntrophus sp. SKADARSKE-3]
MATVPNVTNPQLKFYWTVILEDPQHEPEYQPYVDVLVTDLTTGTTLLFKTLLHKRSILLGAENNIRIRAMEVGNGKQSRGWWLLIRTRFP